jgi:hypothetical protein
LSGTAAAAAAAVVEVAVAVVEVVVVIVFELVGGVGVEEEVLAEALAAAKAPTAIVDIYEDGELTGGLKIEVAATIAAAEGVIVEEEEAADIDGMAGL